MRDVSAEQLELDGDVRAAMAWGEANPQHFGGVWFDNDVAGRGPVRLAVALVHGAPDEVLADLRRRVEHPDRLRVLECAATYRHLRELMHVIAARHMPPRRSGAAPHVTSISLDVRGNRLEVGMSQEDEELRGRLAAELQGEPVVVGVGPKIVPAAQG